MHFRVNRFLSLLLALTLAGQPCMEAAAKEMDTKEEKTEQEAEAEEDEEGEADSIEKQPEDDEKGADEEKTDAGETKEEEGEEKEEETKEETEEGSEEEGEEDLPWELPVFEGYEVKISEPDGANGYYIRMPEIIIKRAGDEIDFSYELEGPDGNKEEGASGEECEVKLKPERRDGTWHLRVKLLYEEEVPEEHVIEVEEALKKWEKQWSFQVDSTPASLQTEFSQNPVTWLNQKVQFFVQASDSGSGTAALWATCNGTQYVSADAKTLRVTLDEISRGGAPVHVTFGVRDHAGNVREESADFFVDLCAPTLTVEGASHLMITRDILHIRTLFHDDNLLRQGSTLIWKKNEKGEEEAWERPAAGGSGSEKSDSFTLNQDGIYQIQMQGSDAAGNMAQETMQIILDTTCPETLGFPEILGKNMRQFSWTEKEGWIRDLTSTTTVLTLDGKLYRQGDIITREGRHIFKALITDAAGNQSVRQASFVIDRTAPVISVVEKESGKSIKNEQILQTGTALWIQTEKAEDTLVSVIVNGTSMQLRGTGSGTEILLGEEKPYEIMITATDPAGNTVQSIWNLRAAAEKAEEEGEEIKPEETVFEQVVNQTPQRVLPSEHQAEKTVEKEKRSHTAVIWGTILFAMMGAVGAVIFLEDEKNRHK